MTQQTLIPAAEKLDRAWVNALADVFTAPKIVYPSAWMDTIPEWLLKRIIMDRLLRLSLAVKEGQEILDLATDSEALCYMYPAALDMPLDYDWTQIYCYLSTRVITHCVVPDDVRVDKLNRQQEYDLDRLKRWIVGQQRKHRPRDQKAAKVDQKVYPANNVKEAGSNRWAQATFSF